MFDTSIMELLGGLNQMSYKGCRECNAKYVPGIILSSMKQNKLNNKLLGGLRVFITLL